MGQFTQEYEQRRLAESGLGQKQGTESVEENLWAVVAERTKSLNHFSLNAGNIVTAKGYEQRGDLSNSFSKSVEEKEKEQEIAIAKRYKLENEGYEEVEKQFFPLPLYSTILLFSPPPEISIEGYTGDSLVYFYHILPGEKKDERTIKALAWNNTFDMEEQANILNSFKSEKDGIVDSSESSILHSPRSVKGIENTPESFKEIWNKVGEIYGQKKRDFPYPSFEIAETMLLHGDEIRNKIYPDLSLMIRNIAEKITEGAQKQDLKENWAIMLNLADNQLLHKDITQNHPIKDSLPIKNNLPSSGIIFDRYKHLAYAPRKVATPCGFSSGMGSAASLGQGATAETAFTSWTSVAEKDSGKCETCSQSAADSHYHCPDCDKSYADETHKSVEQRTKACGCGFNFNC